MIRSEMSQNVRKNDCLIQIYISTGANILNAVKLYRNKKKILSNAKTL